MSKDETVVGAKQESAIDNMSFEMKDEEAIMSGGSLKVQNSGTYHTQRPHGETVGGGCVGGAVANRTGRPTTLLNLKKRMEIRIESMQ